MDGGYTRPREGSNTNRPSEKNTLWAPLGLEVKGFSFSLDPCRAVGLSPYKLNPRCTLNIQARSYSNFHVVCLHASITIQLDDCPLGHIAIAQPTKQELDVILPRHLWVYSGSGFKLLKTFEVLECGFMVF